MRTEQRSGESGWMMAVVTVFIVLLTISGFLSAALTRTDIQVVNNSQNEKESFFAAEAGITEAELRLQMDSPTNVTVGGEEFDAAIVPDPDDAAWRGAILFGACPDPLPAPYSFCSGTLQPVDGRLPYSTSGTIADESLQLYWESDGLGGIKKLNQRNILNVASTGHSGAAREVGDARRRVIVQMVEDAGDSMVILHSDQCGAVQLIGNADVIFPRGVTIDSACETGNQALQLSNNNTLTASGGIDVVGGYNGRGDVDPAANTDAEPVEDPLASLDPPDVTGCTYNDTKYQGGTNELEPGTYCGGIELSGGGTTTLKPGPYIIAGGQLSVTGTHVIIGRGVMFYITNEPGTTDYASVDLGPNFEIDLSAPTVAQDPIYYGILIFQDRLNTNTILLGGGFDSGLDGIIYAKLANIDFQGTAPKDLQVAIVTSTASFQADTTFSDPSTLRLSSLTSEGFKRLAWGD